jgi:ubiquinone/menaquinone biosynthesis C-methylase UbiE
LPFEDGRFDAAACAFGLLHMENADEAMAETLRVLKPGGRYAFTAWHGPDRGGEMFSLVMNAVEQHGTLDVDLPPAPPMFRLADPEEARRALLAVLQWRPASAEAVLEMLYKSVVRMPMILEAQVDTARERIHAAIVEGVNSLRREDGIAVAYPALLVSATRPG